MTADEFTAALEAWTRQVTLEARRLFEDGVAHDKCIGIAISIVDAKAMAKSRSTAALAPPARGLFRPRG